MVALLAGVAPAVSVGTAVADEAPVAVLTESEQALKKAADSGSRVEVVGERTERDTVFANPDGATFALESSIVPVRVNTGAGWTKPDATLERREDGSIGPKASTVDVDFSGGGSGQDLVKVGQDGQSVSMGWPGNLPTPRLEGPRAVYENVLPDVNLILTATVEGFQQVLEVETPAAAALPELKEIEYALGVEGLRLREGAFGSMEALDGNGQVVFRSPTARMWNSAGDDIDPAASPTAGAQPQSVGMLALAATAPADPQGEVPEQVAPPQEGDALAGPGAGDKSAVMAVELGQDSLTVTPDAGLIAATEPEDFPLYIDPSVEVNQAQRTVLSSDGDVFYNFTNGDNGMSVGKCGSAVINGVSYYCGNGYVNRMYFEFSPTALRGKHVLDATFRVTETWSFSCDSRWVDLERTDRIYASSKWPGPTIRDHMGDRDVSAGRGDACSPSQPRSVIEFHDNPAEPEENLAPTVRALADGTYNVLTFMIQAKDETDTISWKRFNNDGTLTATYMSKPAVPGEYGVLSGGTVPVCSTTESGATMISDPTPSLYATPRAASGAESQAMLRVFFDLDYKQSDGTWYDAPQPTTGSVAPTSGHASYAASAKDFPTQTKTWDSPLKQNTVYRYHAYTHSFKDTSYSSWLTSNASPWCYFKVDSTAPKPPVVKFNTVYQECVTGGACEVFGGPGKPGSFTFTYGAGDTASTNTHYQYRLSSSSAWSGWKAATNGAYTTNITPPTSGPFVLNVMSKDVLGRTGFTAVKFLVKEGDNPVGRWDFNEASGAAVDTSTTDLALKNNLTLSAAGATRNDHGRRGMLTAADGSKAQDKALGLVRSSHGAASSSKRVVDTQGSFTVTAWARLDSNASVATVLSQDGNVHSSFYLSYCTDLDDQGKTNTWCVRMADTDTSGSYFTQRVNAVNPPQFNTWTHLGFTVDTTDRKLRFYVNGVLQGTDDLTLNRWSSNGGLQVGRAKYNGAYSEYFSGDIDEVAIWQWELDPVYMAKEAGRLDSNNWAYTELVAQYQPNGASGTSLTDHSGYGNTLTMSSTGSLDGTNIVLDGVDDSASTARPLVDDTGSFTVATTVKLDLGKVKSMPDMTTYLQILGQKSASGSSWAIWFQKTDTTELVGDPPTAVPATAGRWHFGRLSADGKTNTSVQSEEVFLLKEEKEGEEVKEEAKEVTLVASFDAITRTIRLFQGGQSDLQGDPLVYQAQLGSGFTVGKAWNGTGWDRFLPGEIRDIRVWAGAMTSQAQVVAIVG
ncbi:LamG domain-containing protein [Streptomyces filamentosus]|uniref:LamG domain-containing protein n=1 Tax=Streptomyces filamentosus TaxID=67294 RepID=UPI0033E94CA3